MHVLDVGLTDGVKVLGLKLLLEVLGDEAFENLLADLAGEVITDDAKGRLTGTEPAELGAFLDVFGHPAGFTLHNLDGDGDFQGVPATFD
jgi:hypothetical protein